MFDKLKIEEPLRIAENILGKLKFDVTITVRGGGEKSQVEAARLLWQGQLLNFLNQRKLKMHSGIMIETLLVADVRRKEAYKPGDSKARAKRQTSYR